MISHLRFGVAQVSIHLPPPAAAWLKGSQGPRSVAKAMGDPADAAAGSLGAENSFAASFGCTVKAMGNMRKQINS